MTILGEILIGACMTGATLSLVGIVNQLEKIAYELKRRNDRDK
jgi:hypothetical protein